jgi:hypothetical protein
MIPLEGIMITNHDFEVTLDIFSDNKYYVLDKHLKTEGIKLGAALKLHKDWCKNPEDFTKYYAESFDAIMLRISEKFQNFKPWILINNKVDSKSKIALYKKLWKSFDNSEFPLPKGEKTTEYAIESEGCISFYGAISPTVFDEKEAAEFIGRGRYGCIAVTTNEAEQIADLLRMGWGNVESHSYGYPKKILDFASKNQVFFIRPIGEFDDKEWGAVVIAQSALIEECFC